MKSQIKLDKNKSLKLSSHRIKSKKSNPIIQFDIKKIMSKKLKSNKKNIQELIQNLLLIHSIIIIYRLLENSDNKITIPELIDKLKTKNLLSKDVNEKEIKKVFKLAKQKLPAWKNIKTQFINELIKVLMEDKKGGFYLRSLEGKGDQPITGTDLTKMLDEMQEFFYNAKWTEEGEFLKAPDTLISLLRGDTDTFKYYILQQVLPKYYNIYPPFLNFKAIGKAIENRKYEDYPDYLLAYINYQKLKNQWEVSQGLAKPVDWDQSPLLKFANASDQMALKIASARRRFIQRKGMIMPGEDGGISFI